LQKGNNTFTIKGFISRFDEETCREYLVKVLWNGKPRCHQCGNNKKNYKYNTRPVYKCSNCGTQFRVTTGTIFESSKIPLSDWFLAIKLIACSKKSISSHQLAKELGITQKSAWYMETNIRVMLGSKKYKNMLGGIVEVDEVYMVRDTSKVTKQGHGTNKQKVFGMRERNSDFKEAGELRIQIVDKVDSYNLHPVILDNVEVGSWLMSDEWKAYNNLDDYFARGVVNHSKRQYVDGEVHTNSIEGAWAHLRKLISGTYHRPSKEHLQKYLNEFEFRYNHRKKSLQCIFKQAIKQSNIRKKHTDLVK
jgi:transposase-like protein